MWKPQLLLLCFASKILAEANTLMKLQDNSSQMASRQKVPPLPFLLSSLITSRPPRKAVGGEEEEAPEEPEVDAAMPAVEKTKQVRSPQSSVTCSAPTAHVSTACRSLFLRLSRRCHRRSTAKRPVTTFASWRAPARCAFMFDGMRTS